MQTEDVKVAFEPRPTEHWRQWHIGRKFWLTATAEEAQIPGVTESEASGQGPLWHAENYWIHGGLEPDTLWVLRQEGSDHTLEITGHDLHRMFYEQWPTKPQPRAN